MMCNFVLANEGSVDRRSTSEDIAKDGVDIQLTHDDRHEAAEQGIDPAAMMLAQDWLYVVLACAAKLAPLQDDVPEQEQESARDVVRIANIGLKVGSMELALVTNGAGGSHDIGRIARKQVPSAGAIVAQQSIAVGTLLLDNGKRLRVT